MLISFASDEFSFCSADPPAGASCQLDHESYKTSSRDNEDGASTQSSDPGDHAACASESQDSDTDIHNVVCRSEPESDFDPEEYGQESTDEDEDEFSDENDKVLLDNLLSRECRRGNYSDNTDLFFGVDSVDEDTPSESQWLDLPPDAHILAGRRGWSSATFPILCVADQHNIIPLISSVACQRHVWGIDMPVLGLEVSEFGSYACLYLSWCGEPDENDNLVSYGVSKKRTMKKNLLMSVS